MKEIFYEFVSRVEKEANDEANDIEESS